MSDYRSIPLGALPSPKDYRDWRLSRIAPVKQVWPDSWTLPFHPPVRCQGPIGACVAFSLSRALEYFEWRERGKTDGISKGYIYAKRADTDHQGEGMYPRQALENIRKWGSCHEADFPLVADYPTLKAKLTRELDVAAEPHVITGYAAVQTESEFKSALSYLGPVSITIPVYDSFYEGGDLPLPDTAREKLWGYHQVTVEGWRGPRWVCANSWGEDWGDKGWFTIPFNYPIVEAWSVTDDLLLPEKRIVLTVGSNVLLDNGFEYQMDVEPMVERERIFLPVRFVAEHLGAKVEWVQDKQQVIITM